MIFVIILASACDMLAFSPQTHVSVVFQRSGIPWPHPKGAAVGTLQRPGGVSAQAVFWVAYRSKPWHDDRKYNYPAGAAGWQIQMDCWDETPSPSR